MELYLLDESFGILTAPIDDYLSMTWVDRYKEAGECSLTLSPDLVRDALSASYILNSERGIMEITGVSYSAVGQRSLSVTGAGLLGLLGRRVITHNANISNRGVCQVIADLVWLETQGARALPLSIAYSYPDQSDAVTTSYPPWSNLYDYVVNLLVRTKYGAAIEYDRARSRLILRLYEGKNRTQTQSENSRVIFSQSFGNIRNIEIRKNNLDFKNFCYAHGGDTPRQYDATGSGQRREMAISVDGELNNTYVFAMCREALQEYTEVDSFSAEADQSDLVYKHDYDLGDLCDIADDTTGIVMQSRIMAVTTVYEGGAVKVTPQFGNGTLNLRRFIRRSSDYGRTTYVTITPAPEE